MKEAIALAKEADTKKDFSPTRSDNSIHRVRNEPEMQLGSLRSLIGNIRYDGGKPSVESIATQLSGMHTGERAPVLLALQHTHGNRYVQRVVSGIQAKLRIGQSNDIYEQEADRVADAVIRMPEPQVQRQVEEEEEKKKLIQTKPIAEQITRLVQRQVEEEETVKTKEQRIQARNTLDQPPETSPQLEAYLHSSKGAGLPLPDSVRKPMEERFGQDFGRVRLHTSEGAAQASEALNARAFTAGDNIYFGSSQYRPETSEGQRLLAHELTHTVQQGCMSLRSKGRNIPIGLSQRRISTSNFSLESGNDILRRSPDFNQTLRLRRRFTYIGEDGTFQTHNFSPDLSTNIHDWLASRMRVFAQEERPIDALLRSLLSAFRRAHRILGGRVALRRGQHYTYAARIDLSGASVRITDVRINGLSPTAELVMRRLESFPPMQWEPTTPPGHGCSTDFCTWVMEARETRVPALASATTLNCWEAILLAAYYARVVSWQWLHNLYVRYHARGELAFANMLSRGRRTRYSPPQHVPVRGDIVLFWSANHLSHVGLATGRLNPRGSSPEVIAFQGRFIEPRPPVRPRVEPPSVHLSSGGRMRIEYARPPW